MPNWDVFIPIITPASAKKKKSGAKIEVIPVHQLLLVEYRGLRPALCSCLFANSKSRAESCEIIILYLHASRNHTSIYTGAQTVSTTMNYSRNSAAELLG